MVCPLDVVWTRGSIELAGACVAGLVGTFTVVVDVVVVFLVVDGVVSCSSME